MTNKITSEKPCDAAITAQIAEIAALRLDALRVRWKATFGKAPPRSLTGDILVRMLTWKLQDDAYGGHSREVLKLLEAAAKGGVPTLGRRLKPGTQIIREHLGVRHTVTITTHGFMWKGRDYPSLTAIARLITGTNWNGPRFFGLRDPKISKDRKTRAQPVAEDALA